MADSNTTLKRWLCAKVKDNYVNSIYSINKYSSNYSGIYSNDDFYLYYNDHDIDVEMNDVGTIATLEYSKDKNVSHIIETYGDKKILIPPGSNRGHVSIINKNLLDCTYRSNLTVLLPNIVDIIGENKIDAEYINTHVYDTHMKEAFYKFCMKYT